MKIQQLTDEEHEMDTYIGCKIIKAEPEDNSEDERPGYKVVYPDGYISWSPKNVFEIAYRKITKAEKNFYVE